MKVKPLKWNKQANTYFASSLGGIRYTITRHKNSYEITRINLLAYHRSGGISGFKTLKEVKEVAQKRHTKDCERELEDLLRFFEE